MIWTSLGLKAPADWLRSIGTEAQRDLLVKHGSYAKLAAYCGLSETAAKSIIQGPKPEPVALDAESITDTMAQYKSVKFAARMLGVGEAYLRREAERCELNLLTMISYHDGANSNAKGRRAEMDYAKMRGTLITRDLNIEEGSQADWDFDDVELGRVNVKSSREFSYKAISRRAEKRFWKVSTAGSEKCDTLVCLCYCARMETLIGYLIVPTKELPGTKTLRILEKELLTHDVPPSQDA